MMTKPDKTDKAVALKNGRKPGPKDAPVQVRNAGTDSQADKPSEWDKQDETVDESFPASDPPSTY